MNTYFKKENFFLDFCCFHPYAYPYTQNKQWPNVLIYWLQYKLSLAGDGKCHRIYMYICIYGNITMREIPKSASTYYWCYILMYICIYVVDLVRLQAFIRSVHIWKRQWLETVRAVALHCNMQTFLNWIYKSLKKRTRKIEHRKRKAEKKQFSLWIGNRFIRINGVILEIKDFVFIHTQWRRYLYLCSVYLYAEVQCCI